MIDYLESFDQQMHIPINFKNEQKLMTKLAVQ
jgi:hypothetical protein